ncbi:MAG: helix-turn-helix transcriptional regulator [Cyclobacteriaceae bacterium]
MASNAEELTNMLSLTQDSVVKGSNHRIFINLILFLQAGIGLSFIIVPFVIAIYHNRALLQRLNKRMATYQKRRKKQAMKYEVELKEDTISEEVFLKRLLQIHPNLTPHDLTLCTLLRQNYSSKEIAEELNITPGSVNTARYRLRKKLVMERETDLIMYLRKIA